MDDAATTLKMPPGADVAAYKRALMERYANPALKHRTWQICMDGSQKLPQRLLGSIRDRLAAGAPIDRLVMGVAGWMRYVTGIDEQGKPIDVRDPLVGAAARDRGSGRARRRAPRPCPARRARDLQRRACRRSAFPQRRDGRARAHHREGREGGGCGIGLGRVRRAGLRDQRRDRGRSSVSMNAAMPRPMVRSSSRSTAETGSSDIIWSSGPHALKRGSIARITCPTRIAFGAIASRTPPCGPRMVSTKPALVSTLISLKMFCSVMPVHGRDGRDLGERRVALGAVREHAQAHNGFARSVA